MKPDRKRRLADEIVDGFKVSIRRACRLIRISNSTFYYRSSSKDQSALRMRIGDLAGVRIRYGYGRLHVLLRREGWRVNHIGAGPGVNASGPATS